MLEKTEKHTELYKLRDYISYTFCQMAMGMDWTNLKACQMAMAKYIKPQPQLIRTTKLLKIELKHRSMRIQAQPKINNM